MQVAGVDPTSTRKLKARICAASRLLGFSILSRLIFGIQGGNFGCPNFTLMLLNNWANKHCHRCLMGCFFSFFCRMMLKVAHEISTVRDMIRASRITLRFYSAVWKGCRVPHWVPSCCWERTGNCLLFESAALNRLFVFRGRRGFGFWRRVKLYHHFKAGERSDLLVRVLRNQSCSSWHLSHIRHPED